MFGASPNQRPEAVNATRDTSSGSITKVVVTTSILAVSTANATSVGSPKQNTQSHNATSLHNNPIVNDVTTTLFTILVLGSLFIWWNVYQRAFKLRKMERVAQRLDNKHSWRYMTKNWDVLYQLLLSAYDSNTLPAPFCEEQTKSIQDRWNQHNRVAPKRLVQRGIIPLVIHDGELTTEQVRPWGWTSEFPYVKLPIHRQAKTRAYFEFLLPYPDDVKRKAFLGMLVNNKDSCDVVVRFERPSLKSSGQVLTRSPPSRKNSPLSIGAEAFVEVLLPFKSDEILNMPSTGESLDFARYMRGREAERVPLLFHSKLALVRIESRDWGHVELDEMVYHFAQDAQLEDHWAEGKRLPVIEPLINGSRPDS